MCHSKGAPDDPQPDQSEQPPEPAGDLWLGFRYVPPNADANSINRSEASFLEFYSADNVLLAQIKPITTTNRYHAIAAGDTSVQGSSSYTAPNGQPQWIDVRVAVGAEITLLPRFDPTKALEIIQRDKVTIFQGVPTMYAAMLQVPNRADFDISSLRLCVSGGAALPVEIIRAFEQEFNTAILEGYGLSETSPVASFGRLDMERKPGTIGTPIKDVEMRIVDEEGNVLGVGDVGELQIKGPNVMKGYWQMEEATAKAIDADGWFSSGDMATVDEDGYYSIVDRKKEMILRGGYNVYPREVEEVLYEHPAVAEVAVMGIPHDDLGEEIVAIIAFKDGESASEDELRDHAKQGVAAYKYPRHILIIDELPKGPTGKILKREIDLSQVG